MFRDGFKNIAHYVLLCSLLAVILIPILTKWMPSYSLFAINALIFVSILSGVSILSEAHRLHRYVRFLLMLVVASGILNFFAGFIPQIRFYTGPILSSYFIVLTAVLVNSMVRTKTVSQVTLVNAMSGYLLLGMTGSIIIGLIEDSIPGAYSINLQDTYGAFGRIYHSFVTLTTLGYGDVSPVSIVSQSFAIILSVAGVFYMGFLVATLIGIFIADKNKNT